MYREVTKRKYDTRLRENGKLLYTTINEGP